eukprot:10307476-Alexandrium_andersonii.AAC.1
MSASLVGSEMCIRDRSAASLLRTAPGARPVFSGRGAARERRTPAADRLSAWHGATTTWSASMQRATLL